MNPVLLQKQLKDNAADLNDFYKELKTWGEDMKRKEESQKNPSVIEKKVEKKDDPPKKKKTVGIKENPKPKIKYTDYSAWDKFDADAECEKIDYNENDESDLTDESDESFREEAHTEKERGNKFVKDKKWDEAIECYNKAINLYSYDPVYYANRALCFLKKENFIKAELDCTMSLKLDKTYVKAYQRRGTALEALGKLEEAELDFLEVLELEPKNKETRVNLDLLRKKLPKSQKVQRPVSKFTASRSKIKQVIQPSCGRGSGTRAHSNETKSQIPNQQVDSILVKAVNKPIHLQSKKPLKQIEIKEIVEIDKAAINCGQKESFPRVDKFVKTLKTDDLRIIERQSNDLTGHEEAKDQKNHTNNAKMNGNVMNFNPPKTSVQFYSQWKRLKSLEDKYFYMKIIKPENLPVIFKESLDSDVFSEMLEVLAKCFIKNNDQVFDFLRFFSELRRFSTILMFLTDNDKNYLRKLFDYLMQHEEYPKEEIDLLLKKYEMEN